ncbi:MAG TPA: hypothetical protein VME24_09220, partial [Alphaproteobacteria bacterium]|nr:hypothetical protein [Alphaproteobacteria bacterium]
MKKLLLLLSTVSVATAAATLTAHAQGTAFAYQGRLENNGTPANGNYDLMFTLYTTNAGGVAIAGPVIDSGTVVSNGLFTTTIDFGSGAFAGNNYWLDISVSPAGSNTFSELTPRQPILPTPYAMMATTASNLLGELPASQVSGTIPMTQLSSAILTNTETGVTLSGIFSGNGAGLTALNPANLSAGTAAINISGNAATATTAISAGSATTATTATTANNFSGSLSGDVTGTQSATVVSTVGGVSAANVASGANAANAAASANTSGAIVQRDASGNFSAGTITANLSGTATTALNFTGNVTDSQLPGNVPFLNGTNAFSGTNTFAGVTRATNVNNTFVGTFTGNGSSLTALNPASLSAGTAAINISGNAATATTANTAASATTAATATSATTAVTAGTAGVASNLVSGAIISGVTVTNSTFAGNGSSLTALNPANLSSGTAAINISGNAA